VYPKTSFGWMSVAGTANRFNGFDRSTNMQVTHPIRRRSDWLGTLLGPKWGKIIAAARGRVPPAQVPGSLAAQTLASASAWPAGDALHSVNGCPALARCSRSPAPSHDHFSAVNWRAHGAGPGKPGRPAVSLPQATGSPIPAGG